MSKFVIRGIVGNRLTMAPTSESMRTMPAFLSRPTARTSTPNRIGSQMARLRYGGNVEIVDCIIFRYLCL